MQATREKVERNGIKVREVKNIEFAVDPSRITALTVIGDKVKNRQGVELGKIEEIVFDLTRATVSYLVLSFGGIAGIGDKFFALPLNALEFDIEQRSFFIDIDKKQLKKAGGFDKSDWPRTAQWPPGKNSG